MVLSKFNLSCNITVLFFFSRENAIKYQRLSTESWEAWGGGGGGGGGVHGKSWKIFIVLLGDGNP